MVGGFMRKRIFPFGQEVYDDFPRVAQLCRDGPSDALLPRIEDEEARFHVWAASLGVREQDIASPMEHPDPSEDAAQEIVRLLYELSEYLSELIDHFTGKAAEIDDDRYKYSVKSDRTVQGHADLDAEEDQVGSDVQSICEPDSLEAASMLLTAIHGVLSSMLRIASAIHRTAGHFEKRSSSIDQSTLSQVQATLDSPSASASASASISELHGTSTKEAREILQAGNTGVPKLQSSGGPPPRFWISWKQILLKPQYRDRPRYYRRTSLSTPPVLKDAFERSEMSPIYSWTPGTLREIQAQDLPYLEPYGTASLIWRPDHQTYLTVPYDCTSENVKDRAEIDTLDHWERLKFNHESIDGRPLSVISHDAGNDTLAGGGPANWMGQLIPPAHQRYGEPSLPDTQGTSMLAGDISILLGLASLSAPANDTKQIIESSFRPPGHDTWVPHSKEYGVTDPPERGVVIYIFTDRRDPDNTTRLDAWERGETRAILS